MNKSIYIIAINATLKLRSIVIFTSVFFSACNDEPMQVKPKEDYSNAVVVGVKLLANGYSWTVIFDNGKKKSH